jgi:FkbM family methyltransferase
VKNLLQGLLLNLYRMVLGTGFMSTRVGRALFETAYEAYKERVEAGPIGHLEPYVAPGSTVLDIGANIGFFTRRFARWVAPDGRVIAFEPEALNLRRLRAILDRENVAGRVEVLGGVVAERSGRMKLKLNPHHPGDHKIGEAGEEVDSFAIDDVLAARGWPKVSLIKIDVQGAEERVLDGARQTIERLRPNLFVEVHDVGLREFGSSSQSLLNRLAGLGYTLHALTDAGPSTAMTPEQALAFIGTLEQYADFLCLPKSPS